MVILNWRIRRPRLLFAFLSSPRLSIYTFRFRTTPPSLLSAPPFILYPFNFLTARRRDAARYGPRPSYSARRGVPLEKSTPKIWSGEKEKGEKDPCGQSEARGRGWNPKRERAGSLTPYRRAPSRNALPMPHPEPRPASRSAPQAMKKKLCYP